MQLLCLLLLPLASAHYWLGGWMRESWWTDIYMYVFVCACVCAFVCSEVHVWDALASDRKTAIIITKRPVPILIMISIFFSASIKHQKCRLGSEFDGTNKTIEQTALSVTPWWTPKHLPPSLSHVCWGENGLKAGMKMKNSAQVIVYTETVTEKYRSTWANTSPPQW